MQKEETKQFDVELSPEVAEGKFANFAIINHSPTEFVLDFISMLPAMKKARMVSRVILTPEHAKRLAQAISDNIGRYESNFGEIKLSSESSDKSKVEMPIFNTKGEA